MTDTVPILSDILSIPHSLARTCAHQFGAGRSGLLAAAAALRSRPLVVLTGMGGSLTPCYHLQALLGSRGVLSMVVEAAELLHTLSPSLRGAAFVVVSRSGETVEIAKLLPLLKEQGALVVGVTNEPASLLAREADHTVLIESLPDATVAIQTYISTVASLLALGAAMVQAPLGPWQEDFDRLVAALDGVESRWLESTGGWSDFIHGAPFVQVLGRGASYGSAIESAVMLNEIAKQPAAAMTAANFRHGAVEMVSPGFRVLLYATRTSTRHLDLALARELRFFGARPCVVSCESAAPAGEELDCWTIPDLPDALAAVAEIIPVALVSFWGAMERRLEVGRFRYIEQVTRNEERLVVGA